MSKRDDDFTARAALRFYREMVPLKRQALATLSTVMVRREDWAKKKSQNGT